MGTKHTRFAVATHASHQFHMTAVACRHPTDFLKKKEFLSFASRRETLKRNHRKHRRNVMRSPRHPRSRSGGFNPYTKRSTSERRIQGHHFEHPRRVRPVTPAAKLAQRNVVFTDMMVCFALLQHGLWATYISRNSTCSFHVYRLSFHHVCVSREGFQNLPQEPQILIL